MALIPESTRRYKPRSVSTGMAFTIVFTTLATFVILSCFVWGFLVPYLRKKYFPPKPSQTRYNQIFASSLTQVSLTPFPYRRRQLRLSERSSNVAIYNPRLYTPFPRRPSPPESIVLPTWTPPRTPRASDQNLRTSQSLFTPIYDKNTSCPGPAIPKSHSLPRVRSRSETVRRATADKDFGDARDYILALPEPLHLNPRAHADQSVLSTPLERMPDPSQLSTSADKHLHPNKLFQQLNVQQVTQGKDDNAVVIVGNSAGNSPYVSEDYEEEEIVSSSSVLSEEDEIDEDQIDEDCVSKLREALENTETRSAEDDADDAPQNPSITAMHRLRTYRSLVGAPPPEPLSRAGTLTRPKTPVATMKNMYDTRKTDSKATRKTISRNETVSTLFNTVGNSSDRQSSQSSATSPAKPSPQPFAASSLSLLPTPLRIHHSPEVRSASNPNRRNSMFKEEFDNTDQASEVVAGARMISKEEEQAACTSSNATPTAGRSRPTPLTLTASARLPLHQRTLDVAQSSSSNHTLPLHRTHVPSMQASSIYSRDTQGLSIAHTPTTPGFPQASGFRPPFSPRLPSTIDDTTDSDKGTEAGLIKPKASPALNTAHQKVENWNVDTSDLDFDTSPSPSLKHALSTLGPDCQSTHGVDDDDHRHSMISTEINPSEAHLSMLISSPLRASFAGDAAALRDSDKGPHEAKWF